MRSAFFTRSTFVKRKPLHNLPYVANRSATSSQDGHSGKGNTRLGNEISRIIHIMAEIRQKEPTQCREHFYKKAILHRLYDEGIPALEERALYSNTSSNIPLLIGYVDLEVSKKYVFELKVGCPTKSSLQAHRTQLLRYLHAYKKQNIQIEEAALVYFQPTSLKVILCSLP